MSVCLCPWLALSLGRDSYTGSRKCGQYLDQLTPVVSGVGAAVAISPCCFNSAHRSAGMGYSTILTFSSTSAKDLAPGITDAMAECARMNCKAAAFSGTW